MSAKGSELEFAASQRSWGRTSVLTAHSCLSLVDLALRCSFLRPVIRAQCSIFAAFIVGHQTKPISSPAKS